MTDDLDRETRLKRLSIRSWRRGTKEMDLILGRYADGPLAEQPDAFLFRFETLLDENDNDLYTWISGTVRWPDAHGPVIEELRRFHGINDGPVTGANTN